MRLSIFLAISMGFCADGCGKRAENPGSSMAPSPVELKEAATTPALAEAKNSLKRGEYDEAAARLVRLRTSGHEFSNQEAADYRKTLEDAYTRALEAAQKGDPRAKAAVQMMRSTGPH